MYDTIAKDNKSTATKSANIPSLTLFSASRVQRNAVARTWRAISKMIILLLARITVIPSYFKGFDLSPYNASREIGAIQDECCCNYNSAKTDDRCKKILS